jgi:hypothetical protein
MNKVEHDRFEAEVFAYLEGAGCLVEPFTYHQHLQPQARDALARCYSRAALRVRLQPDFIAFSPDRQRVAFVEVKAPPSRPDYLTRTELHIEAMQASFNMDLGDCVYAVKVNGTDVGWSCDQFDQSWIKEIRIPLLVRRSFAEFDRRDPANFHGPDGYEFYATEFRRAFPSVRLRDWNSDRVCGGSGDPYIVFEESAVAAMPDWRAVLSDKLDLPASTTVTATTSGCEIDVPGHWSPAATS